MFTCSCNDVLLTQSRQFMEFTRASSCAQTWTPFIKESVLVRDLHRADRKPAGAELGSAP